MTSLLDLKKKNEQNVYTLIDIKNVMFKWPKDLNKISPKKIYK